MISNNSRTLIILRKIYIRYRKFAGWKETDGVGIVFLIGCYKIEELLMFEVYSNRKFLLIKW